MKGDTTKMSEEDRENQILAVQDEIEELQKQRVKIEEENDELESQVESIREKQQELLEENREIDKKVKAKEAEIKKLEQIDEARAEVEKLTFYANAEIRVIDTGQYVNDRVYSVVEVRNCEGIKPGSEMSESVVQLLKESDDISLSEVGAGMHMPFRCP